MPWYNTSWAYAIPVTVINASSTSALDYAQLLVPLTGAAYTSFHAHAKSDGSDIVVTDLDGTTPLPFALETIDTANSVVYLLVKVSLAANSTKMIYVYYGNPAATSISSYPTTIGPTNAISSKITVLAYPTNPYYNIAYGVICTQHQSAGSLFPNGTLVGLTGFGSPTNGAAATSAGFLISTDGGNTWTTSSLMATSAGSGFLFERSNGNLIGFGSNSGATVRTAYTSADGGNTWVNLPNGASPHLTFSSWPYAAAGTGYQWGMPWEDNAGNLYCPAYGKLNNSDTVTRVWIMKCVAGNDPTLPASWTNPGQVYNASYSLSEPTMIPLDATSTNILCMVRNDTASGGDVWWSKSTDGGVTWSAVTALGLPGLATSPGNATSPYLVRLASGNLLMTYCDRNKTTSTPNNMLGNGMVISTDNGTTWLDRAPSFPSAIPYNTAGANQVNYGEPVVVQRADGKLVMLAGESELSNTNYQNIFAWVFDEDWAVNSPNILETCQGTTAWTGVANVVANTVHPFPGQTNSLKFANIAGTAATASRGSWSNCVGVSAPTTQITAVQTPSGLSYTCWIYPTSIATTANGILIFNANTGTANRIGGQVTGTNFGANGLVQWTDGSVKHSAGVQVNLNQWNRLSFAAAAPSTGVSGRITLGSNSPYTGLGQFQAGGNCWSVVAQAFGDGTAGTNTFWLGLLYTQQYIAAAPTLSVGAEISLATSGSAAIGLAGATAAAAVTAAASGSVMSASISVAGATAAGSVNTAAPAASQINVALTLAGATVAATMTALPTPAAMQLSLPLVGASAAAIVTTGAGGGIQPAATLAANLALAGTITAGTLVTAQPGPDRPLFVDPDMGSLILP